MRLIQPRDFERFLQLQTLAQAEFGGQLTATVDLGKFGLFKYVPGAVDASLLNDAFGRLLNQRDSLIYGVAQLE